MESGCGEAVRLEPQSAPGGEVRFHNLVPERCWKSIVVPGTVIEFCPQVGASVKATDDRAYDEQRTNSKFTLVTSVQDIGPQLDDFVWVPNLIGMEHAILDKDYGAQGIEMLVDVLAIVQSGNVCKLSVRD
jgi:hypothetical protein